VGYHDQSAFFQTSGTVLKKLAQYFGNRYKKPMTFSTPARLPNCGQIPPFHQRPADVKHSVWKITLRYASRIQLVQANARNHDKHVDLSDWVNAFINGRRLLPRCPSRPSNKNKRPLYARFFNTQSCRLDKDLLQAKVSLKIKYGRTLFSSSRDYGCFSPSKLSSSVYGLYSSSFKLLF